MHSPHIRKSRATPKFFAYKHIHKYHVCTSKIKCVVREIKKKKFKYQNQAKSREREKEKSA